MGFAAADNDPRAAALELAEGVLIADIVADIDHLCVFTLQVQPGRQPADGPALVPFDIGQEFE